MQDRLQVTGPTAILCYADAQRNMNPTQPLMKDVMPSFHAEVQAALEKKSSSELLLQLPDLRIVSRCGCGDRECGTFYVEGNRRLNVVERDIIGVRLGDSLSLGIPGLLGIDIDNFGRIVTFEVWGRNDINGSLGAYRTPSKKD